MRIGTLIWIVVVLLIVGAGAWYYLGADPAADAPGDAAQQGIETYRSTEYGIAFTYPDTYFLVEDEVGEGASAHHQILVVEDTQENRDVFAGRSPGREGPVAVALDIFENPERQALDQWIRTHNESNFNLSAGGRLSATTLGGRQAYSYRWSGLYEGDSIAFVHNSRIVIVSGTWLTQDDPIRTVFSTIVESLQLTP